jgi:murein DD-endopeptidase MepM/ murein hydrolase activator NlpD
LTEAQQVAVRDSAAAAEITRQHHDKLTTTKVRFGDNFTDVLRSQQLDPATVSEITNAALRVFKPRTLRAGQQVDFVRRWDGALKSVLLHSGWDQAITITRMADGFVAAETTLPSSSKVTVVQGTITSSLFESVLEAGEHPELAVRLAEIFAWDLDFYTDPRPGDTFRLVFEKRTLEGSDIPSYGRIYVAEYVNGGHPLDAVLFHDPDGKPAYYTAEGKSLQKAFLRSPLKFAARISSHFSRHRFHPVLKTYRAHLGTDYAAPVGTPVQAIASGRVEFSARKGGNGNLIILRHANGFKSYYLHLSQRLVRVGQSVQQGQRIGLVGATGLASGPHLDFRLLRNGQFVDFERMKLPPSNPVAKSDEPAFFAERDKWMAMLREAADPNTKVAQADGHAGTSTAD